MLSSNPSDVFALSPVQERGGHGEEELGRLPSHSGGWRPVCLRQRPQLPATLLHVHHQLHTGAAAGRKAMLNLTRRGWEVEAVRVWDGASSQRLKWEKEWENSLVNDSRKINVSFSLIWSRSLMHHPLHSSLWAAWAHIKHHTSCAQRHHGRHCEH